VASDPLRRSAEVNRGRLSAALRAAEPWNEVAEGAIAVFLYQQFDWR
jgi:hypothetical protein